MKTLDPRLLADSVIDAEVVVLGTGVAGLATALSLAPRRVVVLSKSALGAGGSSPWAQGGVAAAVAPDDAPGLHSADTLEAGAGLCDPHAVDVLTGEGPERVRRLIGLGALFDRDAEGALCLGREGAHGRRRILHAGGDRTGAEIVRALVAAVREQPEIVVHEHVMATDLATVDGRIGGVLAIDSQAAPRASRTVFFRSPTVVLATGGFGQLYSHTTNPVENTGDGLAMAARAGARLADLEFVQFHPTALAVDPDRLGAAPLPLVTEALRGEGAWLLDESGERFMPAIHPLAELAPRDVVARAIWERQKAGSRVYLDARHSVGDAFPERFPTVFESCMRFGIDPRQQAIEITPAAHYAMAGVLTDENGRTSIDGLWACGEVAASGVHGANRLASNSLLEALVFGHRVALDIADPCGDARCLGRFVAASDGRLAASLGAASLGAESLGAESLGADSRSRVGSAPVIRREDGLAAAQNLPLASLRRLAWDCLGLVRDRARLDTALVALCEWGVDGAADGISADPAAPSPSRTRIEIGNLWTVARLVTTAALAREESRGSHYRTDFPAPAAAWCRRLVWTYRDSVAWPVLQRVIDGDRLPLEPRPPAPRALDRFGFETALGYEPRPAGPAGGSTVEIA